jgi:streptogramin lyase
MRSWVTGQSGHGETNDRDRDHGRGAAVAARGALEFAGMAIAAWLVVVLGVCTAPAGAKPGSVMQEYPRFATPLSGACEVQIDHHGFAWVEQYLSDQIARVNPATGQIKEFPLRNPASIPGGFALALDGSIWFTEVTGNSLVRLDPDDGRMTEFAIPWRHALRAPQLHYGTALSDDATLGPDGAIWFTSGGANAVGRLDLHTLQMTKYPLPQPAGPVDALLSIIRPGPHHTVIVNQPVENSVATIDVHTGKVTEYALPTPAADPEGVITGPDGAIWVTEATGQKIARIDPRTAQIHEFSLLEVSRTVSNLLNLRGMPLPHPGSMDVGSDGNLYFAENPVAGSATLGNKIGRFDPVTHAFDEFATPTAFSSPCEVYADQAGSIWFGEFTGNRLGRMIIEKGVPRHAH